MAEKLVRLGRFRVLRDLVTGSGSQGSVYKAVCEEAGFGDVTPGTVVALKVMVVQDDGGLYERLERRTRELQSLEHPNVVRYLGCFREQSAFSEVHVLVLEFLEGESLKECLARHPRGLDADEALRIAGMALDGFCYLSERGIVHRDIKPGNIFLCRDGGVKLIDFEVARRDGGTASVSGNNMIGTFDYMAPDFASPSFRGDETSDVFSFGVCLHEMLTGRTPYRRISGDDSQASFAFLSRWSRTDPGESPIRVSARVRKVLAGADAVLSKSLSVRREERHRDFRALRTDFSAIRFRELSNGPDAWRLLLVVGRGGFGEVFKARDRRTGRLVAIKHLLRAEYAERFRREAKVMAKVKGCSFARLVAFFETHEKGADAAFLVMEYLDGMPGLSLRDAIKRAGGEPLPRTAVLAAFVRYAHGLSALHRQGIYHRDIKPANLYFPPEAPARAAIMDFGVARDAGGTATVGQVPGTLDYMPPETIDGTQRGGPGMDVYALGLCLYEALSGKMAYPRLPDGSAGYQMFFERARKKTPPRLDATAYCDCPELVSLVLSMTEPDLSVRIRDAAEVERRLASIAGLAMASEGRQSEGFLHADDQTVEPESCECVTKATVVPDEAALAALAVEQKSLHRRRRSGRLFWGAVVLLLAAGGFYTVWHLRQVYLARQAEDARERALQEEFQRKVDAERRARAEAERLAKAEEERRAKEEAARKAREEAEIARRRKEADELKAKVAAERLAREAAERKAKEEAARKAREEAEIARRRKEADELKAKVAAERLAREAAERKAKEEAEALRKAKEEADRQARENAEREARAIAEAKRLAQEADRQAREKAEREVAAKAAKEEMAKSRQADDRRRALEAKLAAAKAELDAAEADYERRRAEAMRPGAREDPNEVDREWFLRRRAYRKLEKEIKASLKDAGKE